jgi:hypothetical protein
VPSPKEWTRSSADAVQSLDEREPRKQSGNRDIDVMQALLGKGLVLPLERQKAIATAARTGEIGDGRVFVTPVAYSYRIRTGERDNDPEGTSVPSGEIRQHFATRLVTWASCSRELIFADALTSKVCSSHSRRSQYRCLSERAVAAKLQQYDVQAVVEVFEKQALTDEGEDRQTCDGYDLNIVSLVQQRSKTRLLSRGQAFHLTHDQRAEPAGGKVWPFCRRPRVHRCEQSRADLRERSFSLDARTNDKNVRVEQVQRGMELRHGTTIAVGHIAEFLFEFLFDDLNS